MHHNKGRDNGGKYALFCCCAAILVYCSVLDWTRIRFENIRIHPLRISFFPTLESEFKNVRIPTEFAGCVWTEAKGGGMAEWFRALDLKSGGPWLKSSTLLLSGFVLSSPEFNSSTTLCKKPTGQPLTSWDSP